MATLLDLPVVPSCRDRAVTTKVVSDSYTHERQQVKTILDLHGFVERWQSIWELVCPVRSDIVTGPVPVVTEAVFRIFIDLDKGMDGMDPQDPDVQTAMNIMLPPAALHAITLSSHYGCETDIGFVRLYLDPYSEHENALR